MNPEINQFFASIFEWMFHGFGLNFESFFNDFSCFCHCLFEAVFLMMFYSFLDRSLNCVNLKIIDCSLVLIGYVALATFRRRSIFR